MNINSNGIISETRENAISDSIAMEEKELKKVTKLALYYLSIGWSIFPVKLVWNNDKKKWDKKPLIKWEKYQNELVSEEQAIDWFEKQFPYAYIGVATGAKSGIAAIDFELGADSSQFPDTVKSKTASGGNHFIYEHPKKYVTGTTRVLPLTDIRGDGNFIVVPCGRDKYEWINHPHSAPLVPYPEELIKRLGGDKRVNIRETIEKELEVPDGARNTHYSRFIWKLLHQVEPYLWDEFVLPAALEFNRKHCKPPEDEKLVLASYESAVNAMHSEKGSSGEKMGKKSQADTILEIVKNKGLLLFQNDTKDAFVQLPIENHKEIWPCRSKMIKRWLARAYWEQTHKAPSADALTTALNVIEAQACFNGSEFKLHNRIAWHENAIWYDMSDLDWRAVKIIDGTWQIESNPPILFRRYLHQQPQVSPDSFGDIRLFLKYANVAREEHRLLLLVYIVSCFIPDFPHPILINFGAQGSAKSMMFRLIKLLVDPSALVEDEMPTKGVEFAQKLAHHWYIFLDNVSYIPDWCSNMLCKAVTGGGFSKRELYSDEEDVIFNFKRCIGISGINLAVRKDDLLERCILLELDKLSKDKIKTESELFTEFNEDRPKILAGIFDTIARAMQLKPSIQLLQKPRMADFTFWGCAITEALGYIKEQFLSAYYENIGNQTETSLSENSLAVCVRILMEKNDIWEETPSTFLLTLTKIAQEENINTEKEYSWPKAANILSRRLNELKANLDAVGITVTMGNDSMKKQRFVRLQKNVKTTDSIVVSPEVAYNDINQEIDTINGYQESFPVSFP